MQEIRASACRRRASVSGRARLAALAGVTVVLAGSGMVQAQEDTAPASATAIGDPARDLLFTPVPRCRVLDTRVEGEPLVADVPRAFDVAGPLAGQGGAADCLVPFGPATVVVLNLTAVPARAAGTLMAGPSGAALPDTSVLSFNGRRGRGPAIVSNEVTLPICDASVSACDHDLVVVASGETHLVADVAGYYSRVPPVIVPWSAVFGKPPGFADNVDNDTHYSAGTGLREIGQVFSVDTSVVQSRVSQACPSGSSIGAIAANGTVTCRVDGGTTYSAGAGLTISGTAIAVANQGISSAMLAGGAVSAGKIAADAVGSAEIANRAVLSAHLALGSVNSSILANNSVLSQHILDSAVGSFEIATDAVGAAEIATEAVGSDEIAAGAVGSEDIASGAVRRSEIQGAERGVYLWAAACGPEDFTMSATCTTPSCVPFPVPLYWTCDRNCASLVPVRCDNTLVGYLLSPSIE